MSKKVRLELTHHELAVVRALLGKANDTLQVGELFNHVADKCDVLNINRIWVKFEAVGGCTYAIGKE